ncbi:MAG: acyltransferase [Sciscionella sp.]
MTSHINDLVCPEADAAPGAQVGPGTRLWHHAQVAGDVVIGFDCTLGKSAYVGSGSRIGNRVKIGNHTDIFGARIEDNVMISPQAVLTEDPTPRATTPSGQRQDHDDWTSNPVTVRRGATIGAGARVAPGIVIGPYALVGIGAVVLRDVPAHALVLGNPARCCGWVCRCAIRLTDALCCPRCHRTYERREDELHEVLPYP